MLTPREEPPLPEKFSPKEDGTHAAASSRTASPTHYQPAIPAPIKQDSQPNTLPTSYSSPHQAGQPAQHTTNQLFRPPSSRTASPTHYQPAIPVPIKQDSQPNTLPTSYSGPHQTGQPAQHTTIQLFRPLRGCILVLRIH